MKVLGYVLIVIAVLACLMAFGLYELAGGLSTVENPQSARLLTSMNLPCLVSVGSFIVGIVLVMLAGKKAQQAQEEELHKKQKEEDDIIKKWIDKPPKQPQHPENKAE
jgi:hypothetical protein